MKKKAKKETILIVDDIPDNIDVLVGILEKDYLIKVATSGEATLKITMVTPPDLILLDVMMPAMDGYEVCRRLKSYRLTEKIPVIFVTAKGEIEDETQGFAVGAVDYITKPVSAPVVQARVRTHLILRQSQKELQDLLSKTLMGAVRILTDILSFIQPDAFDRANRLMRYARRMATFLELSEPWRFELAAMLSHIGIVALPSDVLAKMKSPQSMSDYERTLFDTHPTIGKELIEKIPRLGGIAEMIGRQKEPWGNQKKTGEPRKWDEVLVGSQILKTIIDFDMLIMSGSPPKTALAQMRRKVKEYSPVMLTAVWSVYESDGAVSERRVKLNELQPGMVLLEDVVNETGVRLVKQKSEITDNLLSLLKRYSGQAKIREPIRVLDPRSKS